MNSGSITICDTRDTIIRAAVDRIAADGLWETTMPDIGMSAGIGTADVYRHFSSPGAIVSAYYNGRVETVTAQLQAIDGFSEFTLQEQLQLFYETLLEGFFDDRRFVAKTFNRVFIAVPKAHAGPGHPRESLCAIPADMIRAAVSSGAVPAPVFETGILGLMAGYSISIVNYWLRDSSPQCIDTSVLLDKSLGLICAFLEAGLANRAVDLVSFLLKKHATPQINSVLKMVSGVIRLKRNLSGGRNGG